MEVARGVGSGLGGLYVKGALPGQLLTISRKQLTLVAGGSPSNVSQQGPKMSKHQDENRRNGKYTE